MDDTVLLGQQTVRSGYNTGEYNHPRLQRVSRISGLGKIAVKAGSLMGQWSQ